MNSWFFYFLTKAIRERKGRFLIAAAAVTMAVTAITALVLISMGVRDKMGQELRQYGANMIVTDSSGAAVDRASAEGVRTVSEFIRSTSFQVYGTAAARGTNVEIIGMTAESMSGFRVYGRVPASGTEVMIGTNLKDPLAIKAGDVISFVGAKQAYTVTGIFERGTEEDSAVVMPLEASQQLLKTEGVSAVLLSGDTRHMKDIEDAVALRFPALRVKTIRQVAVAEERVLAKVELLMLLVSCVVLFTSVIALGSTMGANVIERMEEIGLMKSIGATKKDIEKFFVVEAGLAGLAGAIAGCFAGIIAAEAIARTAFGSYISPNVLIVPAACIFGVLVSVLSSYFPVRDALRTAPATILRGE